MEFMFEGVKGYLAVHHYYGRREATGDESNIIARPLFYEKFYGQLASAIKELAPGPTLRRGRFK